MKLELATICVSDREFYVTAGCIARTGDQTHHAALFFLGVIESRMYADFCFVVGIVRWLWRIWQRMAAQQSWRARRAGTP